MGQEIKILDQQGSREIFSSMRGRAPRLQHETPAWGSYHSLAKAINNAPIGSEKKTLQESEHKSEPNPVKFTASETQIVPGGTEQKSSIGNDSGNSSSSTTGIYPMGGMVQGNDAIPREAPGMQQGQSNAFWQWTVWQRKRLAKPLRESKAYKKSTSSSLFAVLKSIISTEKGKDYGNKRYYE